MMDILNLLHSGPESSKTNVIIIPAEGQRLSVVQVLFWYQLLTVSTSE